MRAQVAIPNTGRPSSPSCSHGYRAGQTSGVQRMFGNAARFLSEVRRRNRAREQDRGRLETDVLEVAGSVDMSEQLLKVREVADELRLSRETVYELIRQGMLKAINVSPSWSRRQLRIKRRDVEAFKRGRRM